MHYPRTRFHRDQHRIDPPDDAVFRVTTRASGHPPHRRSYIRCENGCLWLRYDTVELNELASYRHRPVPVYYHWADLMDHETELWAADTLVDEDFPLANADWDHILAEAETLLARVISDIAHHHCSDNRWGARELSSPTDRLAVLDEVSDRLQRTQQDTDERLATLRAQLGTARAQRWQDELAELRRRIDDAG